MRLEKEKKRMMILIGGGVILAILFLSYAFFNTDMDILSFDLESIFTIIAIMLYPLGIAYGWNSIIGVYRKIRGADKYKAGWNVGATTVAITIMNIAVAGAVTICFGWIFGVYNAVVTLRKLKKDI